jgi:hypothetical protein
MHYITKIYYFERFSLIVVGSISVMKTNTDRLSELLRKNSKENNTDKKIEILYNINSLIPEPLQLTLLPSMSDDCVKNTLHKIENNKSIFRELIVSMHK